MMKDSPVSDLDKGQTGQQKTARNPVKIIPIVPLKKPDWIRVKAGNSQAFYEVKRKLRENNLHTVCEEASCPNIGECFGKGTATFMILGDLCTRRCPFCDVAHGRPKPPDAEEPAHLARTIAAMALRYVVITSVDRDDLRDGGAQHFVDCIRAVRSASPQTRIEVLTPDFRGRAQKALDIFAGGLPDVMNHNLETVARLYKQARPGADYQHSLELLRDFKRRFADVTTKSGIMVGLGETDEEILEVMRDLRAHDARHPTDTFRQNRIALMRHRARTLLASLEFLLRFADFRALPMSNLERELIQRGRDDCQGAKIFSIVVALNDLG